MLFEKIDIENYRNLDGVKICFHTGTNYLIGENNIGKSNLLALLNTICNAWSFEEQDYIDTTKPISINFSIKLKENEMGVFGDNFSPEEASVISIKYIQTIDDARPIVVNAETNEGIQLKSLRKINYMRYDTTANPTNELRFDKQKGAGALLNHVISKYTVSSEEYLNNDNILGLLSFLNEKLRKIKAFNDFGISATILPKQEDVLSRLVCLIDNNSLPIGITGNGVQYMAMAAINIINKILELYKSKLTPLGDSIYTTVDGKKILPIVLAIDEPEVHLHPYMQRSLINYYKRILCNEDAEFLDLIKFCFDIDGLDGQLLIVTHSTDALIDDYRNLIRFFKDTDTKTHAISGSSLIIKDDIEKHLIMHFPDIKEAFYSKCVLIVEGETEYGCIRSFAKTIEMNLDDFGICFINARGEGSIPKLERLFSEFQIPSILIFDNDVKSGQTPRDNEFFTNQVCFEMEIIDTLIAQKAFEIIESIPILLDSNATSHILDQDFIKKAFKKMGIDPNTYQPKKLTELSTTDLCEYKRVYSAWYYAKKGILLGRIIGSMLKREYIPSCYTNAILKAKEVARNGM